MSVLGEFSRRYTVGEMPDYEGKLDLVDGRLEVNPPALWGHARIATLVANVLQRSLGDDYLAGAEFGIQFSASNYRQPDVAVVRRDVRPAGPRLTPTDVLLAVEVVSPSSVTTDRITKPAQYAMWGIEGFWRVETDPELSLTAYASNPGDDVYTELGSWGPGETVLVERPLEVSFAVDDLAR